LRMFWAGLGIGLLLGVVIIAMLVWMNSGGYIKLPMKKLGGPVYSKVMLIAIGHPFSEKAIDLSVRMAGREGLVETLYIMEIGLDRPLQVVADEEIDLGMSALEKAAITARKRGKRLLPRLEKARMGSKKILEIQKEEGFDLLVLDLQRDSKNSEIIEKIARYIQKKATCTVVVLSEK
jgi:Universal stress protein family